MSEPKTLAGVLVGKLAKGIEERDAAREAYNDTLLELAKKSSECDRLRKALRELLAGEDILYDVQVRGRDIDEVNEKSIDVANLFAAAKHYRRWGMTDETKPEWSEYDLMLQRLPYTLTKGVVATREGLRIADALFEDALLQIFDNHVLTADGGDPFWLVSWPDAAKRLRYREGEPYCDVLDDGVGVHCYAADEPQPHDYPRLHRLAAIIADDADGFLVLHWCVTGLGR